MLEKTEVFYNSVDEGMSAQGADSYEVVQCGETRGYWSLPIRYYKLLSGGKKLTAELHPVSCYGYQLCRRT